MIKKLLFLFCMSLCCMHLYAQTTVHGRVVAADDGLPMIGATVYAEGTTQGTVTDHDGRYKLTVPDSVANVVFSYTGYKKQVLPVAANIDVVMKPSAEMLDEVVVTAMAVERQKRSLGYAVQDVKAEALTQAATLNVGNALQGKVAGVQISQGGAALGASQRISIRGNSSFSNNEPLIVVDGVPINNATTNVFDNVNKEVLDAGNALTDINPEDIESVSVLKGGSAAIYGMRAGNGVILITTKKGAGKDGKDKMRVSYDGSLTFDRVFNLPRVQNKYGQGDFGSEYDYKQMLASGTFIEENVSYQDFVTGNWHTYDGEGNVVDGTTQGYGYSYYDGLGNGINDASVTSWGPRLDIGLRIPQFNSPVVDGVRQATDWVSHPDNIKDFFQTGISQSHLFAISNSGERGSYRASAGYMGQSGTVPCTDLQRYTANISGNYAFNKYISFDATMNFTHTESDNLLTTGYSYFNPVWTLLQWFGRQVDMNDLKKNWQTSDLFGRPYNWNHADAYNPFFELNNNKNTLNRDRLLGKGSLWINATDWLKIEGRVGYDVNHSTLFRKVLTSCSYPNGYFLQQQSDNQELNADVVAYLNHSFGSWNLSGIVGANHYDRRYQITELGATMEGLTIPGLYTVSNVSGVPYSGMGHIAVRSNSWYANATAGWRNQLFLEGSIRQDWHSTLKESFVYPSLSASWVLTETFTKWRSDAFNYLKLRLNWANVGNATSAYMIGDYFSGFSQRIGNVSQFCLGSTMPNENLRPENINTNEIGLEAAFFDNRLRLDVAGYYKLTTDEILEVQITPSSGYFYQLINAGKVRNVGAEVSLSAEIFRNKDGWSWNSTINWSLDRSMVLSLVDGIEDYKLGDDWECYNMASVGKPWGTLVGTDFVYNEKGEALVDENGMPLYQSGQELGNVMPDWLLGWNNEISYKNLSFGFLLDYRHGGDFLSTTAMMGAYSGQLEVTVEDNIRENGAVFGQNICGDMTFVNADGSPNTTVVNPATAFEYYYLINKLSVLDGSFLKLREMHITYRLPKSWLKKLRIVDDARISIVANNVAILWLHKSNFAHIDPESNLGNFLESLGFEDGACPPTRSIGIKLNLVF